MPEAAEAPVRQQGTGQAAAISEGKPDLNAYLCVCGWWHLTKKGGNGRVREFMVQQLQEATDAEFISLVRAELSGHATPDEAAALRSDELLHRWKRSLNQILVDYQDMLTSMAGCNDAAARAQRRRHQRKVEQAATRRKEVNALLGSLRLRRRAANRITEPLRSKITPRNRAIDRLIEAHQDEFDRLLREEEEAQTDGPGVWTRDT